MRRSLALLCLAALVLPAPAYAHGIAGTAESFADYLWLGYKHMLAGWDHLLFAAGVALLAGSAWRAAKLVSLFALGHSLTLLVATLAGWQVSAEFVDVVIALSLAYIGIRLLRGRPDDWTLTKFAIFGFGLVHGLGLSTRLQEIPLPDGWPLVGRILSFNLGVELGQLTALLALGVIALLVRRLTQRGAVALRPLGIALTAVGLVSAALLGLVAVRPDDSDAAREATGAAACVEQRAPYDLDSSSASAGGHTRRFYAPGTAPKQSDVEHQIGDGYTFVRYRADLDATQREALAKWAKAAPNVVVVPTAEADAPAVAAATLLRTFTCPETDVAALSAFHDRWIEYIGVS